MSVKQVIDKESLYEKETHFQEKLENCLSKLYRDQSLKRDQISAVLCKSERQIARIVLYYFDMSPCQYLRIYRLEKAKELISKGYQIGEAALEVGFSSHSHFSSSFRSIFGCTATDYVSDLASKKNNLFSNGPFTELT